MSGKILKDPNQTNILVESVGQRLCLAVHHAIKKCLFHAQTNPSFKKYLYERQMASLLLMLLDDIFCRHLLQEEGINFNSTV